MERSEIEKNISYILESTDFDFLGEKKVGKVRDVYIQKDKIILIATDRYSAFDRNLALIPFKGQVLTQTSHYNFSQTEDIIQNHIIEVPDQNVVVAKNCKVAPVEMVVRGFITGVTQTALWTRYNDGQRDFGDFKLPDGMVKNQRLDSPVITPTTKFEEHDRNLTSKEVVEDKFLTEAQWQEMSEVALKLFKRGQNVAEERDLILVDTKYEFGYDENDKLTLIDEIHTQDSSRYWFLDSYEENFSKDKEPKYFDKEFLRLWFKEQFDPYKDKKIPEAPKEMIAELSARYIEIYEKLSGQKFRAPDTTEDIKERIKGNLEKYKI